jgi:hypothetical protein
LLSAKVLSPQGFIYNGRENHASAVGILSMGGCGYSPGQYGCFSRSWVMSKTQTTKSNLINHKEYIDLLTGVKARIQSARIAASRSVNKELILLYWDIGRSIVERQKDEGWGKSVVEQLSKDIQKEFSGVTGVLSTKSLADASILLRIHGQ